MTKTSKKTWLLPVTLCIVAMIMSFLICGAYLITKEPIERQALEAQEAARRKVLSEAVTLVEVPLRDGDPVDYCYAGYDAADALVGYVSKITVNGFGGEIEVTVGINPDASITAVDVGGANFSETSGLGAKTRDAAFTEQFKGKSGLLVLKKHIDSVTGASVSSGAVVGGVNAAVAYMSALLPSDVSVMLKSIDLSAQDAQTLLPGASNVYYMGGATGIDGWWQADQGYIVQAVAFGRGPITVKMGFTPDGVCTGILIGDENFTESQGYGARVLEEAYWSQFLGKSEPQVYGEGVDAISGATSSSNAALSAINACLSFDPATTQAEPAPAPTAAPVSAETADAVTEATVEEAEATPAPASQEAADAVTEATVEEAEPTPVPTPAPASEETADAVTEATEEESEPAATEQAAPGYKLPDSAAPMLTLPTPDAVTEASVEEEATPTPAPTPDAVTEASVEE